MKIIIIILDLLILCALVLVAIGEPSSRFKINRRYPVVWTSRVSGGSIESEFSHHLVQTIDDIFNKEYCHCTSQKCKCCRHLAPPMFVPKSGLGCAQFKYLGDQTMVVTVKFDDQVIMHKKLSSECGQQTKQNAILIAYFTPPLSYQASGPLQRVCHFPTTYSGFAEKHTASQDTINRTRLVLYSIPG